MKKLKHVYWAVIVLAVAAVAAVAVHDVRAQQESCDAVSGTAGSDDVRSLAAAHPDSVPAGEVSGVVCNHDGGFAHAGAKYSHGGPERAIVDCYLGAAGSMGWVQDREGQTVAEEVAGFCFSKDVEGKPAMMRVRFDTRTKSYTIQSEVALDGSTNKCW
ncbi:hypothetical protein AB0D08_27960 [Kitasatospora sp. NPDC048540]|uniref:hypothetical protein n=1 Tax=Kitasatospora sp. NPDC048540 TaxID=3155634 RepID=UPI0033D9C355